MITLCFNDKIQSYEDILSLRRYRFIISARYHAYLLCTYIYMKFDRKNMVCSVKTSMYFSTPFPKTPLERSVYFQSGFDLVHSVRP